MSGTISDWIIVARKKGLEELAEGYHTEKSVDDQRLVSSGLPTFDRIDAPYQEFSKENERIMNFLAKYDRFVVRALPVKGRSDLPRRPKIGVHSFEECQEHLDSLFSEGCELEGNEQFYKVSLVENEPTDGSGIIVSTARSVIAEAGDCQLDVFSHGGANPSASCIIDLTGLGHITDKTFWEHKTSKGEKVIRTALSYLELSRDNFNPLFMRGYFEFVVTVTDKIKFWDYKVNEMYLK